MNGKGRVQYKRREVKLVGVACAGNCLDSVPPQTTVVEEKPVFWSNPENWPDNILPGEDAIVEIPKGRTMILDIAETPILKNLQINGVLKFKLGMDIHLRAKIIFVRAGELQIGTEAVPFTNKATITLFGNSTSSPMAWSNSVEGGNKLIANVGTITMFGKQRTKMSRLRAPAKRED